jgi:hypothetical protein
MVPVGIKRANKEGVLAVEEFSRAPLKQIDCGVFAVNVVANFSGGHGCAHLLRRAGYGVGT